MKKFLFILLFFSGFVASNTLLAAPTTGTTVAETALTAGITSNLQINSVEDFLNLTPRAIKEATGKKLNLKEIIQLKTAQKALKKGLAKGAEEDMPKWLYIVLAIFGLAWIIMGIRDDWSGKNWWVNLILVVLGSVIIAIVGIFCPLIWGLVTVPGLIHALIKMKEYY